VTASSTEFKEAARVRAVFSDGGFLVFEPRITPRVAAGGGLHLEAVLRLLLSAASARRRRSETSRQFEAGALLPPVRARRDMPRG
jgi:hypothetical protein